MLPNAIFMLSRFCQMCYRAACAWGQWSPTEFVSGFVSSRSHVKFQRHDVKCIWW